MADWAELRRLAEAATPGPWRGGWAGHGPWGGTIMYPVSDLSCSGYPGPDNGLVADALEDHDANFIAAANPAAVLALLAERDALEEVATAQSRTAAAVVARAKVCGHDPVFLRELRDEQVEKARKALGEAYDKLRRAQGD